MSLFQVDIDFDKEPIGTTKDGKSVYFKDIWPTTEEIAQVNGVKSLDMQSFVLSTTRSPNV